MVGNGWWSKHRLLVLGSRGSDVEQLEKRLNSEGLSARLSPDNVFDINTERAVKEFQRKNFLVPDGKVGPVTYSVLFNSCYEFSVRHPRIVYQGIKHRCWASALESAICSGTWPGRQCIGTQKIVDKYKQHLTQFDAIPTREFKKHVTRDYRLAFEHIAGRQLTMEDVLRLIREKRMHLLLMEFDVATTGHAYVVYGVRIDHGAANLRVMDPLSGARTLVPMGSLRQSANVLLSMPVEGVAKKQR